VALVGALLLLALVTWLFLVYSQSRTSLTREIHERNAELVAANARLQQEIAERTHAQEQLRMAAERLARSNRELRDFVNIASHDLQEPLRKAGVFADRVRTKAGAALDANAERYLARMQQSLANMRRLIHDLLDFSRVTARPAAPEPTDLGRVVREAVAELEVRLEQSGGSVEAGRLPTVHADPRQMHRLFLNLIVNALKYSRPAVPPCIRIYAEAPSQADADAGMCRVCVADNGIGFAPEHAERIFHPFQRLHAQHEYEGTGMGLTICRKIVESSGGTITAKGEPGAGATFIIVLPAANSGQSES